MTGAPKVVTTEATEVFDGSSIVGETLLIQNDSDTDMFIDVGPEGAPLTVESGRRLEAGETWAFDAPQASSKIRAIHGGTGEKLLRWVSY